MSEGTIANERVLSVLPALYACRFMPDFLRSAVRIVPNVIPCDRCAWVVCSGGEWDEVSSAGHDPDRSALHARANYDRHVGIPVDVSPRTALVLTCYRNDGAFNGEDRSAADSLRPHLCRGYRNAAEVLSCMPDAGAAMPSFAEVEMTRRERQVAHWISCGKSNPEIAAILGMAPRTVEKHVERVLEKLGVENRTAAALAVASGFSPGAGAST